MQPLDETAARKAEALHINNVLARAEGTIRIWAEKSLLAEAQRLGLNDRAPKLWDAREFTTSLAVYLSRPLGKFGVNFRCKNLGWTTEADPRCHFCESARLSGPHFLHCAEARIASPVSAKLQKLTTVELRTAWLLLDDTPIPILDEVLLRMKDLTQKGHQFRSSSATDINSQPNRMFFWPCVELPELPPASRHYWLVLKRHC
jgi:hypothetical protein